jgi:hypothetical protein
VSRSSRERICVPGGEIYALERVFCRHIFKFGNRLRSDPDASAGEISVTVSFQAVALNYCSCTNFLR